MSNSDRAQPGDTEYEVALLAYSVIDGMAEAFSLAVELRDAYLAELVMSSNYGLVRGCLFRIAKEQSVQYEAIAGGQFSTKLWRELAVIAKLKERATEAGIKVATAVDNPEMNLRNISILGLIQSVAKHDSSTS